MTTWTPTKGNAMKAIITKASELNRFEYKPILVEMESLDHLRLLLMQAEDPLIIFFAGEDKAPAEVEIMVYNDSIEGNGDIYDQEDDDSYDW